MLLIKNFTCNKINQKYLNKVVEKTLKIASFKKPAEISLVITGEKRMRALNKKYRGVDRVTDVLSFGCEETGNKTAKFVSPPSGIVTLGDVFICYNQAKKQAKQNNCSVKRELEILLIHGILHLLGYNHEEDDDAVLMQKMEKEVLENL